MDGKNMVDENSPFDIADGDLDDMAAPYEEGRWAGCLGHVWLERPRIRQNHQVELSLQLPEELMEKVKKRASSEGLRPGELIRQTLSFISGGGQASGQKGGR